MLKDRIKELRKQHGWTQAELAKKMSVSQQTIGSWEVGRAEPNSEALTKLAHLFNRIRQKSPILYRWVMNAVRYEGYRW